MEVTKNKPGVLTMCSYLYIFQGSLRLHRTGKIGAWVSEMVRRRVVRIQSVERVEDMLQGNSLAQFSPECESWALVEPSECLSRA